MPGYFKTASEQYNNQKFLAPPDYDAGLKAAIAANPAMQGNAGKKYEELIDQIQQQDMANQGKLDAQEQARARADFFRSLTDAGEASRGTKGIGGLMSGLGQSLTGSQIASQERATKRMEAERAMSLAYAKNKSELENARRAEARGDFESAFKHKAEAAAAENVYNQHKLTGALGLGTLENQILNTQLSHADRQSALRDSKTPPVMRLAAELQSRDKKLSDDEAYRKASSYLSGSAYLNSQERAAEATQKRLSEALKTTDQMLSMTTDVKDREKLEQTQQDIIRRFQEREALLKNNPNSAAKQTSSVTGKYQVSKES
jgi:hypothetical protein